MSDPWIPSVAIDSSRARALVRARFPEVAADTVEALGAGWDNSAFLVDGRWVFRFAHREQGVPLLAREAAFLPRLAPLLPVRIPEPRFHAENGPDHPWPFLGYELLPGRTADRARLGATQRMALARPLAAFLSTLHRTPPDSLGLSPEDHVRTRPVGGRLDTFVERLTALEEGGWIASTAPAHHLFVESAPSGREPRTDTVVHGDVYSRHLVVDQAGGLTGVIDWGDMHRGDPALDLMALYTLVPFEARATFLEVYGPIDEGTRAEARRWALFHAATVAWYGERSGDPRLRDEGLWSLANALRDV